MRSTWQGLGCRKSLSNTRPIQLDAGPITFQQTSDHLFAFADGRQRDPSTLTPEEPLVEGKRGSREADARVFSLQPEP